MIHRIAGIAEDCIERAAGRPAARPAQQSGSVGPGPPIVSGPWAKLRVSYVSYITYVHHIFVAPFD